MLQFLSVLRFGVFLTSCCLALSACGSESSRDPYRAMAEKGAPRKSCTDRPPQTVEALGKAVAADTAIEGFQPGRIVDVASHRDGTLYVLDAANFTVTRITSEGQALVEWGRRGPGPGEFVGARAIAVAADRVYVLDSDRRVSVFDSNGAHIRDISIGLLADDIAVAPTGDLIVAADLRQFGGEHGGVTVFDSTGSEKATLIRFNREKYGQRPASGPHSTPLRVFAGDDGRVAVAYVTDNSVDVFRNNQLETTIRGCMPSEVLKFYQTLGDHNRRSPPMRRYHSIRTVINAVHLDPAGDIFVASPGGWDDVAHITRYDSGGRPTEVLEFPESDQIRFASYAVFLSSWELVTWDGSIWQWTVRDAQRPESG